MKKLLVIAVIAAACWFGYTNYVMPGSQTWVHGTWEYQLDKPGEEIDYMVFDADGTVALQFPRGKTYLTCVYVTWGETLNLQCDANGQTKEIEFDVSEDKKKLENAPRRSVYLKVS